MCDRAFRVRFSLLDNPVSKLIEISVGVIVVYRTLDVVEKMTCQWYSANRLILFCLSLENFIQLKNDEKQKREEMMRNDESIEEADSIR